MTQHKLLADFNRYFTSSNGVDVPARVSVPRDEWRALHAALSSQGAGEAVAEMVLLDGEVWDVTSMPGKWAHLDKRYTIIPLYTRPQAAQPSSDDVRELSKWLNEESTAPINRQALSRVLAAQPALVVGTVTGYQSVGGWQQWQFMPSGADGLESSRFEVVISAPPAAPQADHSPDGGNMVEQQVGVVTELEDVKRWFMNPETGMLVQTERGPWVRYVDVLAAFEAKKAGGV